MTLLDSVMWVLHVLFAGLWTGSVLFVVTGILPAAIDGDIDPEPLSTAVERLRWISRTSALLLLLTGGHLAGTLYTVERLTTTRRGYLVIAMVALWFLLAALVEVGSGRFVSGLAERKLRAPARAAKPFYYGAAVVAVLLLANGGLLAAG